MTKKLVVTGCQFSVAGLGGFKKDSCCLLQWKARANVTQTVLFLE